MNYVHPKYAPPPPSHNRYSTYLRALSLHHDLRADPERKELLPRALVMRVSGRTCVHNHDIPFPRESALQKVDRNEQSTVVMDQEKLRTKENHS